VGERRRKHEPLMLLLLLLLLLLALSRTPSVRSAEKLRVQDIYSKIFFFLPCAALHLGLFSFLFCFVVHDHRFAVLFYLNFE
jgi:hypothetical protein